MILEGSISGRTLTGTFLLLIKMKFPIRFRASVLSFGLVLCRVFIVETSARTEGRESSSTFLN